MQISKNKKYHYCFFTIFLTYALFNGGNSNLLIQINFIVWSLFFVLCLKDKNYFLHFKNFYTNNYKVIFIYLIFLIFLVFQIIPLPLSFLSFFSPAKLFFLKNLGNDIVYSSISLSPTNSFFQILNFISFLLIVLILKMIFYTKRHKYRFYYFLSCIGFFISIVAVLLYLNGNPDFLFLKNSHYKKSSSGFFINRTVFSVFLLFCLISSLELLKNFNNSIFKNSKESFFVKFYIRLFIVFITIGVITSFSRIGNFLLIATLFLYFVNELIFSNQKNNSFKIIILIIILFDLVVLSIFFGASEIIDRFYFLKEEFSNISDLSNDISRFEIIKFSINEIKNFLYFGYGLGSFETLFQLKFSNPGVFYANHSHADLFEFIGELGLFGTFLILIPIVSFFLNIQKNLQNYLLIFFLLIILFFDFSLHMPIVQILFITFFIMNNETYGSS